MEFCEGCGAYIDFDDNHHCDPKRVGRRDTQMQRGREPKEQRRPSFNSRLAEGVQIMTGAM
jgi:hypothetical protein